MKLYKTIKARVLDLNATKEAILYEEWENWQAYLNGNKEVGLYSATHQQADRFLERLGKRFKSGKKYPLVLRNDCVRLKVTDNAYTDLWFRVPVHRIRGGLWCPITIPDCQRDCVGLDIRECKLIRKGDHWSISIMVEKDVDIHVPENPSVLGVDMGEKRIATTTVLKDGNIIGQPKFYGKEVRGIRRHSAWLRKRLGEKKALETIKKVGHIEKRRVRASLHRISKSIVEDAKGNGSVILMGDLTGIRKRASGKGRRFNRIVANMPYYSLGHMIEYKANWEGIPVIYTNESYSSINFHICNNRGKRNAQSVFVCNSCGTYNADYNGSYNIAKRGERLLDHVLSSGGLFDSPHNSGGTTV